MNENENPTPEGADSAGVTMLWLMLAFLPTLIGLPMVKPIVEDSAPRVSLGALLMLAAVCCFGAAFGVLRKVKESDQRIVLAFFLGAGFFVLNVFIVLFVGCSNTGGIAP